MTLTVSFIFMSNYLAANDSVPTVTVVVVVFLGQHVVL